MLCRKDEFTIECLPLGTLMRLRIWHDNSGKYPGWFLEKVVVQDLKTSRVYEFPCYRWLAKDLDDGHISRELLTGEFSADFFHSAGDGDEGLFFYRAMLCIAWIMPSQDVCPSDRLSVCLSHADFLSKRLNIRIRIVSFSMILSDP